MRLPRWVHLAAAVASTACFAIAAQLHSVPLLLINGFAAGLNLDAWIERGRE